LLTAADRRLEEVSAIAVSQAPGHFTGLRLSLATAQGLAWALGCTLKAVSTLEILAAQLPYQPEPIAVLMDAKRQEVTWASFAARKENHLPWPPSNASRLPACLIISPAPPSSPAPLWKFMNCSSGRC